MTRARVLASIVSRIHDYREGDIDPIDTDHINHWVSQFDEAVQVPILTELDHVFSKAYIPRSAFANFFADVVANAAIVGEDPCGFWVRCRFFNQQRRGASQKVLLEMFNSALQEACGLSIADCGEADGPLVYIDDAAYTGIHVIQDLEQIIADAANHTDLYMILYGVHNQGAWYAERELKSKFRAAGKSVTFKWFCELDLENTAANTSDVLWPKSLPDQEESKHTPHPWRTSLVPHGRLPGEKRLLLFGRRTPSSRTGILEARGPHSRRQPKSERIRPPTRKLCSANPWIRCTDCDIPELREQLPAGLLGRRSSVVRTG